MARILKKKESILLLQKYLDQPVVVLCATDFEVGAVQREVHGTLKGFDSNVNLVMGEATEFFRVNGSESKRKLGAVILRGGSIVTVLPKKSLTEVANPGFTV